MRRRIPATILMGVTVLTVLLAAIVPDDLRAQNPVMDARERAETLRAMSELLDDPDPFVRRAAFESCIESRDNALITLAMDRAFASDDVDLKTEALRVLLDSRSELALTPLLPDRPSDVQRNTYEAWVGTSLTRIARSGDEFRFYLGRSSFSNTGQVVPSGLRSPTGRDQESCLIDLAVAGPKLLTGSLECTYSGAMIRRMGGSHVILPVRIDVP